jgi:hypothetical protein
MLPGKRGRSFAIRQPLHITTNHTSAEATSVSKKRIDRMPVVVFAALILFFSAMTASPDAAHFCADRAGARAHCLAMAAMAAGEVPAQMLSAGRCAQTEPMQPAVAKRCDDTVGAAPLPITESQLQPAIMPSGIALVAIAIVLMLGTIEVLFRCTIYEQPRSSEHRQTEGKRVKRNLRWF